MGDIKAKRVYIVSYFSLNDPRSLVAALRPYKLAAFLEERGESVTIITPNAGNGRERVVSEGPVIDRVKFLLKIFPPDYTLFWSIRIFLAMRKEWKEEPFYLLTTCPPYGLGFLGLLLKGCGFKFTWICDFRDLWMGNPLYHPPVTKRFFNPWFERMFYRYCDIMTFNTAWDLEYNCRRFPFLREKGIYVRNGFDVIRKNTSTPDFRFVYAGGTTKGEATPYVIKILTTLNRYGIAATCDFYGEYDDTLKSSPYITYHGVLSPEEITTILSTYRLGFIYLPAGCERGGRVAQKFYDYMGAGVIPVVVRPSLEMVNMMKEFNTGVAVFDATKEEDLVHEIEHATFSAKVSELHSLTRSSQFERLYEEMNRLN